MVQFEQLNVEMRAKLKIVVTFFILLGTLLIKSGDGATDTLVPPTLPNGRQCFCPGDVETYTCTVVDGIVTVWSGTAFDCPPTNLIQLLHSLYLGGIANGVCTSGAISGNGTSVDTSGAGTCYTSELSVNISANMDGQTVVCMRDNTVIDTNSLRVASPPSPPSNVLVTEVGMSTFTVTWVEPTSNCGASLSYDVVSDCGGPCLVNSSTSGICSGWTAPQSCSVMIRANSDLCGGQTGSFSTVVLILAEPSPPAAGDVSVLAVYSNDSLDSLSVTFPTVSPVEVAPGLSPTVTYSVQTVGDPQVVPMDNCNATLCQYQTEFTSDNRPSNDFTVTVTVSNGIGDIQSVNTPFQVPIGISSLVNLTVVVIDSNANVSANVSSSFQGSTGLTVTYGISPNCDTNTEMAGDTPKVVLTSLQPNSTYCYSIYLTQGELSFKVMGVFRTGDFYVSIPPIIQIWIIVVVIICAVILSFTIGIIVGILLTRFCGICVQGIRERNCGTLLLVILLIIVFGLGIGFLIGYCCVKNKKEKDDKTHLESQEMNPPPADSLYADPNTIEHQPAPGTEDQYAMVDRKVKKNTKPKPTPPEALYQDPNTIDHETAASGDTYAVVDKPKRSSKKKGGPDVVPPASEGLTYADIDLSSKRPKPGSGRQAPQQPGEYPKEHPVEYSSVDHGNTSQL